MRFPISSNGNRINREQLKNNHDRQPDVGEPKLHPTAGVTVVGARKFLVAYNVNLNTADVGIANKIAKAIRHSSGGLRYVKSMGVELKGVRTTLNLEGALFLLGVRSPEELETTFDGGGPATMADRERSTAEANRSSLRAGLNGSSHG